MRVPFGIAGAATAVLLSSGVALAALPTDDAVPDTPSVPTAPTTVTLGTDREAWYQLTQVNTCNSPVGCLPVAPPALPGLPDLPVAPSVFPADTLHVGWAAGVELARTYVSLDRSSLPRGAKLVAGTLEVPLLADQLSGTLLVDSAGVKACLATTEITDGVVGALSAAPGIDCSVSSPLSLEGTTFVVDLQPFIAAWNAGTPDEGLAFTPFTSSSVQSAWAVAMPGKNAVGLPHISAKLSYVRAAAAVPPAVVPPVIAPAVQPVAAPVAAVPATGQVPTAQQPVVLSRPRTTELAAGIAPWGWAVFVFGILAVLSLGFVASTAPVNLD